MQISANLREAWSTRPSQLVEHGNVNLMVMGSLTMLGVKLSGLILVCQIPSNDLETSY